MVFKIICFILWARFIARRVEDFIDGYLNPHSVLTPEYK